MYRVFFLFAVFFSIMSVDTHGEPIDQKLLIRLQNEGVSEMREREKSYENIHIKWIRRHDEGGLLYDYYSQNADSIVKCEIAPEFQSRDKPHYQYRFAKNGIYYFNISKRTSDSIWKIDEVKKSQDYLANSISDDSDVYRVLPVYLITNSIANLVENPGFLITAVSSLENQPEETISVDFEIVADGVGEDFEDLRTGTILFLPARGWVTKKITLNFNRLGQEFTTEYFYVYGAKQGKDYSLIQTNILLTRNYNVKPKELSWEYEILESNHTVLPKEEFYLSYYGLPEPRFDVDRISLFQFLLVISGTLIILIAIAQIIRKQRMKV